MDRHRWRIGGSAGWFAWIWLGAGVAHAGTISPTDPSTLSWTSAAPVSVSLYQLDSTLPVTVTPSSPSRCARTGTPYYRDVTDCYLPEIGKSVFVVINGSTATPTLVPPVPAPAFPLADGAPNPFVAALTTSAYPGQLINVGSGTAADAVLGAVATSLPTSAATSVTGWQLTPQDGGMMAVIQVEPHKVIIPQDGTADGPPTGSPRSGRTSTGGNLDPAGDLDTGPAANSATRRRPLHVRRVSGSDGRRQARPAGSAPEGRLRVHCHRPVPDGDECRESPAGRRLPDADQPQRHVSPSGLPGVPGDLATFTASAAVFSAANVRGEIIGRRRPRAHRRGHGRDERRRRDHPGLPPRVDRGGLLAGSASRSSRTCTACSRPSASACWGRGPARRTPASGWTTWRATASSPASCTPRPARGRTA